VTRLRLVPVVRVNNEFHARVIAARLGSEGIVTELRGGISSPYPMGDVEVLVSEVDFDEASTLLLADEVESAFDDSEDEPAEPVRHLRLPMWARVAMVVALGLVVWVDALAYR
jgi:hypothetical protein